jgi:hypothetical protein
LFILDEEWKDLIILLEIFLYTEPKVGLKL